MVDERTLLKSLELSQKDCIIGRGDECDFILNGKEVSRQHARIKFEKDNYIIEDLNSTNSTFVNGHKINSRTLTHGDEIIIGGFTIIFDDGHGIEGVYDGTQVETPGEETKSIMMHYDALTKKLREREAADELIHLRRVWKSQKKLKQLANQDRLTGLYNRRYFDKTIAERLNAAKAIGSPLSLIFIDLDHFKKINDTFGHDKGDEVLKRIAYLIRSSCRQDDVVARYGGEEFVVIFSKMTSANASAVAESIRRIIEEKSPSLLGLEVTVSIGVATYPDHAKNSTELICKADQALYRAKSLGRNRIVEANV